MDFYINAGSLDDPSTLDQIFERVFRSDFSEPGFAVLELDQLGSEQTRSLMIDLKVAFSARLCERDGLKLDYEWMGRFDQQVSTPFHRDNAGDMSVLMLGYEPTSIDSQLLIADYTRFMADRNLTPDEFYDRFNPLLNDIETELVDYVSEVSFSDVSTFKIIVINNSAPGSNSKGVFHKAVVPNPDETKIRLINSVMLNAVAIDVPTKFSTATEKQFPFLEGTTSMVT